jgi:sporulation protein YlmC with PRC-barrel domain
LSNSSGYLKREALVGKSVVSKNAEIIGTVLDLAVSTDGRLAIQVQKKGDDPASSDLFIGAEEIQAVGDVILLKSSSPGGANVSVPIPPVANPAAPATAISPPPPPSPSSSMGKTCQKCGYVNSANAKFCIKCGASLQSSA